MERFETDEGAVFLGTLDELAAALSAAVARETPGERAFGAFMNSMEKAAMLGHRVHQSLKEAWNILDLVQREHRDDEQFAPLLKLDLLKLTEAAIKTMESNMLMVEMFDMDEDAENEKLRQRVLKQSRKVRRELLVELSRLKKERNRQDDAAVS